MKPKTQEKGGGKERKEEEREQRRKEKGKEEVSWSGSGSGSGSGSESSSGGGGRSGEKSKNKDKSKSKSKSKSRSRRSTSRSRRKSRRSTNQSQSSEGEDGKRSRRKSKNKSKGGTRLPPPIMPGAMPAVPGGGRGKGGRGGRGGGKGGVDIKHVTKAIMKDDLTEIQSVLNKAGIDVNAKYSCSSISNSTLAFEGATLLHLAVFLGKFNIAKFILVKNANLNVRCDAISDSKSRFHSVTAFHMVVALCSLEMIGLFLKSGADLAELCDEYVTYKYFYYANVSVFHLACFRKDANNVMELLIEKIDASSGILELLAGEIRPHNEKHSTDKSIVNLSQSNAKNIFRDVTCLHIAVALNRKTLVKMLMQHGARVDTVCGEVSFKYELTSHAKELANANRPRGQKEITHGLHSYEEKSVTQLAFLTERTALIPILKDWKRADSRRQ